MPKGTRRNKGGPKDWSPEELRRLFDGVTGRRSGNQECFFRHTELEKLWTEIPPGRKDSRLALLVRHHIPGVDHKRTSSFKIKLSSNYLRILSALVSISWEEWEAFEEIFVESHEGRRTDAHLPFSLEELKTFLGDAAQTFFEAQHIYSPITIPYQSIKRTSLGARLPVVSSDIIGQGASGDVYKEQIVPGYLQISKSEDVNTVAKAVARKHIRTKESFHGESETVSHLQSCLTQHLGITRCLGMIIRESKAENKVETHFDIFYELASFDLRRFLNGPDSEEGYKIYHQDYPSHYNDFEHTHILEQSAHLADALNHLHSEFYHPKMGQVCFAHNDFKPDNILVFYSPDHPAGVWKIADFGLSNIKLARSGQNTNSQGHLAVAPRDLIVQISPTTCKRNPAGYSAPEIERQGDPQNDGRQSDIWSFGCVFSLILASAVGGSATVRELNGLRFVNGNDRFYESCPGSSNFRVKTCIVEWLSELPRGYNGQGNWVRDCVDLVFDIFRVPASNRTSADGRNSTFGQILSLNNRPSGATIRNRIYEIRQRAGREDDTDMLTLSPPTWIVNAPVTPPSESSHIAGIGSTAIRFELSSSKFPVVRKGRSEEVQVHKPAFGNGIEGPFTPPSSVPRPLDSVDSIRLVEEISPTTNGPKESSSRGSGDMSIPIFNLCSDTDSVDEHKHVSAFESVTDSSSQDRGIITRIQRSTSVATDLGSSQAAEPPIRQTHSAPVDPVGTPGPLPFHSPKTPDSKRSSLVNDHFHVATDVPSRIKFPDIKMDHTRLSPDGKYVAFWNAKKALICHTAIPHFHWISSDGAKIPSLPQYKALEILPPSGSKCVTVAFASGRAVVHFSGRKSVELHVYNLPSEENPYGCKGKIQQRIIHDSLAGLLDISLAVNGIMLLRFFDHIRLGHIDQIFPSEFEEISVHGSTADACIAPNGTWLTVLTYDSSCSKEYRYVRNMCGPEDDPKTFTKQAWYSSSKMNNLETDAERPCYVIPLPNAIARFYTSGSATIYQNINTDKRIRTKLDNAAIVSAAEIFHGDSLIFITASGKKTATRLGHVRLKKGPEDRLSLESATTLSDLCTSWMKPYSSSRYLAVTGIDDSKTGEETLFALIASSDGTLERIRITRTIRPGSMW